MKKYGIKIKSPDGTETIMEEVFATKTEAKIYCCTMFLHTNADAFRLIIAKREEKSFLDGPIVDYEVIEICD